ncbi:MAG: ATP-dependent DNA helicase [Thermoplasmatota archaeon]
MRPRNGVLECLRCSDAGRARTVMAKGKAIHLGQGQISLGSAPRHQGAFEAPLRPEASDWHAPDGGAAHEQLGLFPYDQIRPGQKRFTRDVTMAVQRGRHLVAEAPTGIGKTAASLAPALQAAIEQQRTVMFLTSRQSQHHIAVETLRQIQERRGARFMLVDLVSKRDMCLRPEAAEMHPGRFPDFCAMETRQKSCQYLGEPDQDVLKRVRDGVLHVEQLMQVAKEHQLCPHILASAASTHAQVVVADYNHLFSDIRDRSLEKLGLDLGDIILIVDEAHNLPDRIRQNHAHKVTPFLIDSAESEARQHRFRDVQADLDALRKALRLLSEQAAAEGRLEEGRLGDRERRIARLDIEHLHDAFGQARNTGTLGNTHRTLQDMIDDLAPLVKKCKQGTDAQVHAETLQEVLEDWGRFRTGALRYLERDEDGLTLHLRLLDPSVPARRVFDSVHSAILMSGTLRPPDAVRDLLGLEADRTSVKTYASPYPPEHRLTLVQEGVSTRYKDRSPEMWDKMALTIADVCRKAEGNVALFAPSYDIIRELRIALEPHELSKESLEEAPGMTKADRDGILDQLRGAKKRKGALLTGVLGGSFSEGVDYPDNLLSAIIIAGLPLPPPDLEVDASIGYFERRFPGKGRLYGYTGPAMNKVLQAMGRGIRGPDDKCATILLDFRYLQQPYRGFLPELAKDRAPALPASRFIAAHNL